MKHIKLFNTDTQYQEFASNAAQPIPNVSYVTETDEVHYNESNPILFAYEYQGDKFIMGVVIGSDIYVDTYETGFIVADGDGKFSTALAYTNDDLINIQNAIKDHYHLATSTIKTKASLIEYTIGDTVPDWDAYNVIRTSPYLLFKYKNTELYNAGWIESNKFNWYVIDNEFSYLFDKDGVYNGNFDDNLVNTWNTQIKDILSSLGVNQYELVKSQRFQRGDSLPLVERYRIID